MEAIGRVLDHRQLLVRVTLCVAMPRKVLSACRDSFALKGSNDCDAQPRDFVRLFRERAVADRCCGPPGMGGVHGLVAARHRWGRLRDRIWLHGQSGSDFVTGMNRGRIDMATPYLREALRFIGISDARFVSIGPTTGPEGPVKAARESAYRRLTTLAANF